MASGGSKPIRAFQSRYGYAANQKQNSKGVMKMDDPKDSSLSVDALMEILKVQTAALATQHDQIKQLIEISTQFQEALQVLGVRVEQLGAQYVGLAQVVLKSLPRRGTGQEAN
jgi:hypothetical protein